MQVDSSTTEIEEKYELENLCRSLASHSFGTTCKVDVFFYVAKNFRVLELEDETLNLKKRKVGVGNSEYFTVSPTKV